MFISVFCVIYYIEFNSNTWITFPMIITSMELSNGNQLRATLTGFNGEQMVLNGRSRISANDRCALHKRWKKCFKEVLQMVECSCYCCRCDYKTCLFFHYIRYFVSCSFNSSDPPSFYANRWVQIIEAKSVNKMDSSHLLENFQYHSSILHDNMRNF